MLGFVLVCVCCLLIMIMMIEIVFSPCFFFLASFCVFMLCPFVAELSWWSSCLLSVAASRASPPRSRPCVLVDLLFIYFIPLRSTPKKTTVNWSNRSVLWIYLKILVRNIKQKVKYLKGMAVERHCQYTFWGLFSVSGSYPWRIEQNRSYYIK